MRLQKIVYLCHLTLRLFELTDLFITPKVRYKGAKAQIPAKVIIVTGTKAFKKASLIMFNKIANVLSIVSFLMVASMSGGAYFGYKYVTSEQFKAKMMNEVLGNVQGLMPDILDNALPDLTGPTIPKFKQPKI